MSGCGCRAAVAAHDATTHREITKIKHLSYFSFGIVLELERYFECVFTKLQMTNANTGSNSCERLCRLH